MTSYKVKAERLASEVENLTATFNLVFHFYRVRADAAEKLLREFREALQWATERLPEDRHTTTCGALGKPLCPAHAVLVKTGETHDDRSR